MAQTKLTNLINPEVMAQMISASLPNAIKFSPIAKIDTTLQARPGNTITVPKFAYIGDAEDVAEGVAMGTTVLTATTTEATVKKAGKAVELTDESVLSGYGDPVGETTKQLKMAIAAKIDADCLAALAKTTLTVDETAGVISYDGVVRALDKFEEEDMSPKLLFIHPKQVTQLRLDPDFKDINKYPLQTVMTGVIGEIAGCQVIPSRKIKLNTGETAYENYIVKTSTDEAGEEVTPALTIYLKRNVELEDDRDILAKTTVLSADEHYVAHLSNESKVLKVTFKKA